MTTAGFPTKLSESIACGTPVITNDTSDIKNYIRNGKNGFLLELESFDVLCNQLKEICSMSGASLEKMKSYCRQDNSFDYHGFILELNSLFI